MLQCAAKSASYLASDFVPPSSDAP
jgi:hypothetical protein